MFLSEPWNELDVIRKLRALKKKKRKLNKQEFEYEVCVWILHLINTRMCINYVELFYRSVSSHNNPHHHYHPYPPPTPSPPSPSGTAVVQQSCALGNLKPSDQVSGSQEDGRPSGAQLQKLCVEHGEICRGRRRRRSWWQWGGATASSCCSRTIQQASVQVLVADNNWQSLVLIIGISLVWQRCSFNNYLEGFRMCAGIRDWTNNQRFTEPQPAQRCPEEL